MELPLKQKLFYFFPVLFCFCLPFGSLLLSGLIIAWTLTSLFNLDLSQLKHGLKNKNLLILFVFFAVTLVSALFSKNKEEALFGVEIKMSFILFPYLLFCFKWPINILRRCVISFVSGSFFACLYLIARAFLYALDGHPDYFFYSLFSDFIHASYFAMYLILAIVFVVVFYGDWFKTQKSVIYSSWFFISVFIICIFLCSSKLGMISFFICLPLLLAYRFRDRLSPKVVLIILVGLLALGFISFRLFPGSFDRLNSLAKISEGNIDKTSSESTTVRMLIWHESLQIIRQHFIFGTGVGDANDALYEAYAQNGLTGALHYKFNAHNQFLQTFIGLGIIGFLLLLMITVFQLFRAFAAKNFLLCMFSLLIVLNFAVESMLQTSAGILFFTFFLCFFNLVRENELLDVSSGVN